jgi:hypothetical protein
MRPIALFILSSVQERSVKSAVYEALRVQLSPPRVTSSLLEPNILQYLGLVYFALSQRMTDELKKFRKYVVVA